MALACPPVTIVTSLVTLRHLWRHHVANERTFDKSLRWYPSHSHDLAMQVATMPLSAPQVQVLPEHVSCTNGLDLLLSVLSFHVKPLMFSALLHFFQDLWCLCFGLRYSDALAADRKRLSGVQGCGCLQRAAPAPDRGEEKGREAKKKGRRRREEEGKKKGRRREEDGKKMGRRS